MAKAPHQKLKLLYLARFLLQQTDEQHPASIQQMIGTLSQHGISAERKSIYDDLDALRLFGLDIVQIKGRSSGYYIGSRDFELPELKLLVDSVQSSKFITEKKTLSLIKKIEGLASVHDAQLLQRQVYVRERVKSMNESVYYNVDEISGAINADRVIRFHYFEYAPDKSRHFRRNGGFYEVSPFALMWDDENYYMLAYEAQNAQLRNYRVDKMTDITALDMPREGKDVFRAEDMSTYTKRVFGMFGGLVEPVKLRFAGHLAGAVIDRFGKNVMLIPEGDGFTVNTPVVVSPQFFAWIFGFGTEAEVVGPDSIRQQAKEYAKAVAELYEEKSKD